jgi:hypothetical protein
MVWLSLLLPAAVHAQRFRAVNVRDAERAISHARTFTFDMYLTVGEVQKGIIRDNCDELTGEDCFKGDRACPMCTWYDDRRDMRSLGRLYDEVAVFVARAPPGVRQELLDWLAAQRVGVWTRLGELDRARAAAQRCPGAFWLCEALRAYVEHHEGRFEIAEQRFRAMLRLAPGPISCDWRDLRLLRDSTGSGSTDVAHYGPQRRFFNRVCPTHEEADGFWTLADPLFTRPGNDRMTAHYARVVDLFILEQHRRLTSLGESGVDQREYSDVLRHGWPTAFIYRSGGRAPPPPMTNWQPRGINQGIGLVRRGGPAPSMRADYGSLIYGRAGQSFVVLASPAEALAALPSLFQPMTARDGHPPETYRPRYGAIEAQPLQTGFFLRAGHPTLVVRTEEPADAPLLARTWQVRSWDGSRFRDGIIESDERNIVAWIQTPWQAQVVSVEALFSGGAYRARSGTRPPEEGGDVTLSSLVIIDARVQPSSIEQAARAMLPTTDIADGAAASAYWELYTPEPRNATIELTIRPIRRPSLGRLLGIGGERDRVVRWTEEMKPDEGGVARRAVALDLDGLQRGEYDIIVTLLLDTGSTLVAATRVNR